MIAFLFWASSWAIVRGDLLMEECECRCVCLIWTDRAKSDPALRLFACFLSSSSVLLHLRGLFAGVGMGITRRRSLRMRMRVTLLDSPVQCSCPSVSCRSVSLQCVVMDDSWMKEGVGLYSFGETARSMRQHAGMIWLCEGIQVAD